MRDNGGTANGGVDLDQSANTLTINVTAVNDAPVNSVPGTQSVNEDATLTFSSGGGNAITISDVDVGAGNETVTLTVASGTLALGSTAGLASFTNNAASITLTGTVANINAAMNGLTYHGNLNFNGTDTLVVSTNDNGNTGSGGPLIDTDNVTINVTSVNDAPAGTDKTVTMTEGDSYIFSTADFGFTDPNDSANPNSLLAVKMTTVPGAGTGTFTNNGVTVNAGNSVLATDIAAGHLVFTPAAHSNGAPEASFTFQVQDNGGTANGGVDLDQSANTLDINVNAVNDAPINSVPLATQNVNEEGTLTFSSGGGNAITISDIDVGSGNETVTLTVTGGTLALGSTAGLVPGFTNNAASITFTGTVANVNAAMNGLTYTGNLNFNGTDTLVVGTNDNGNTGAGGPKTDSDNVTINVAAVNDAPVNGVPGAQTVNEDTALVFNIANGNLISISDVDANGSNETVTLSVSSGALTLNGTAGLFFTVGDGTADTTMTFFGTVAAINTALNGLSYTGNLNFNGSDTLNITTNDGGNTGSGGALSDTDPITINVTAVNDVPSFTVGANQTVLEDSGLHTVNGFATGISAGPTNESGQTVNFITSNDNNALFSAQPTIDASGNLTYTSAANANGSATVTVQIHDNGGTSNGGVDTSASQTFTVTVGQVNDAPSGANATLTTLEDTSYTFSAADFGFSDPVDAANASGANNFQSVVITTVPGAAGTLTDNNVVLIAGNTVSKADIDGGLLKFNPAANANGSPEASFTFQVRDNGGTANSGVDTDPTPNTISFNVTSVNDAPAGADKTVGTAGTYTFAVADFGFTDPADAGSAAGANAFLAVKITTAPGTGTLTNGVTPVNAGDFVLVSDIAAGHLVFTPSGGANDSFTFQVQDNGGTDNAGVDLDPVAHTLTIDQDIAPTVGAGHTLNYTENQGATAFDPVITVTDSDSGALVGATVQISTNYVTGEDVLGFTTQNGISGSFNPADGKLTLSGSSSVAHYQTALASVTYINTSDNPSGAPRTVTIIANDGTLNSTPVTDTINVTPVNDAPVVTAGHTLNYTENQAPTAIDTAITVSDVDNTNLASATLQITGNYANGQDLLAFTDQNGITGSFDAPSGKLTLTGSSSVANYQAALASVTYANSSENPSGLTRTVTVIVNDGTANSVAKTETITVTPVNDAPVTTAGGTLSYTENQGPTAIDASVTVSDPDNTNLSGATVQLTTNYVNGQDILGFTTQNGITGVFSAATGTMTLSGSSSVANYQAALESVTYFNNSDNPSGLDRTVLYTANDGTASGNSSSSTIQVTPVNDAPVVTATGTLAYTEDQAATAIAPALTVTDADTTTLTTATVTISANYVNGEDVLAFSTQNGITGSFDIPSGTMTLTGTASVANYQTALESVTYVNASQNPSTAARTVTFKADDGQGVNHLSAGSNHTITVASVDDAPTVTVPGAQDPVSAHTDTAITGISTNDVDAGALAVKVSLGTSHGNVTLDLSGGATLADATTNGTHSVHITGTLTQVNAALSSLIYHGDAGFTGPDALTVQTDDLGHTGTGGPLSSSVGTVNIGVIPKVWFIDNSATGAQDGSQAHPFQTIAAFNAVNDGGATHPQTGDYIYLKTGSGVYSEADGIHLLNGQQLVGGGDSLSFTDPLNNANTISVATAGTRPVIDVTGAGNDAIHLAQDNTIHGFNIATDNATAIGIADNGGTVGTLNISNMDVGVDPDGGAVSGNLGQAISITHGSAVSGGSMAFGTVNSAGGTNGIALGGTLATSFSATGGTLSGHTGSEFFINGGSGTVSYAGNIGDGSGLSASIASRTAGSVTLSGNISDGADVGGGISVLSNSGGTIDFTGATKTLNTDTASAVSMTGNNNTTVNFTGGGLDIDTTSGIGFSANTGTYSVTGSGNTINTTSGTALNLGFLTVGAGGVTFASATTTSAPTGISIDTVTGGAISVNGGSIAGATSNGVNINAAHDNITIASSVASTSDRALGPGDQFRRCRWKHDRVQRRGYRPRARYQSGQQRPGRRRDGQFHRRPQHRFRPPTPASTPPMAAPSTPTTPPTALSPRPAPRSTSITPRSAGAASSSTNFCRHRGFRANRRHPAEQHGQRRPDDHGRRRCGKLWRHHSAHGPPAFR